MMPDIVIALRKIGIALLPALIVAACTTVGPDYVEPTTTVQPDWLEYDDPLLSKQPPLEAGWWSDAYGDTVLDQLVETALEQNLSLRSAGLRVLQAHQQLAIAIGSQYLIAYHRDVGDQLRAHEMGEIALKRVNDMGYRWGEATALQELGVLAQDEGRLDDARGMWSDALAIRRELGDRYGTAETLAWLGRLDGDEEILREAVDLAREIETPTPFVLAAAHLGEPIDHWLGRTRHREAIQALVGLDRLDEARAILDRWDVEDRGLLRNVPVFRAIVHSKGHQENDVEG